MAMRKTPRRSNYRNMSTKSSKNLGMQLKAFNCSHRGSLEADRVPFIKVMDMHIPQTLLPGVYKSADCVVIPSRGEGWGRPHVEALSMEKPLIATFWSGPSEFMSEANSYPLRINAELLEITEGIHLIFSRGSKYQALSKDINGRILSHFT